MEIFEAVEIEEGKEQRSQFCIIKMNGKFEFDIKRGLNTGCQGNHKTSGHMDRQKGNQL